MTDVPDDLAHYLYIRPIPEFGDGVAVFVAPMIFADRLMIGVPTLCGYRVDDYWCYPIGAAVPAAMAWDPTADTAPPPGWLKHAGEEHPPPTVTERRQEAA